MKKFPNSNEEKIIENVINIFKKYNIKFTKQKFPKGLKIHGKDKGTRITFHLYNVDEN